MKAQEIVSWIFLTCVMYVIIYFLLVFLGFSSIPLALVLGTLIAGAILTATRRKKKPEEDFESWL